MGWFDEIVGIDAFSCMGWMGTDGMILDTAFVLRN